MNSNDDSTAFPDSSHKTPLPDTRIHCEPVPTERSSKRLPSFLNRSISIPVVIGTVLLFCLCMVFVFLYFSGAVAIPSLHLSQSSKHPANNRVVITSIAPAITSGTQSIRHAPLNTGKIILFEDGRLPLLLLDTHTMNIAPLLLDKIATMSAITELAVTHDNTRMIFTTDDPSASSGGYIVWIYTLPDFRYIASIKRPGPNTRVSSSTVSPDNHYMLIDESCCPGDFGRTIATLDGKVLAELGGSSIAWSPDSKVLAISKGTYTLDLPTGPQPTNDSVFLEYINGDKVTEKEVLESTNQISYAPVVWKDNHGLVVSQSTYSEPFPKTIDSSQYDKYMAILEKPQGAYRTLDIDTGAMADIVYTNKPTDFSVYSPDGNWKMYSEYGKESSKWNTYICRSDGTDKFRVTGYSFYIWLP